MPTAVELLRQGRTEELWQMCCGFLSLNINEFMDIQERLLLKQLDLLNHSPLGAKILRGARPKTLDEFRRLAPLTTYKDYCPELLEKEEDILPSKSALWVHTSGWSGEYPHKWIPMTADYARELSVSLYGIGMLSCCNGWGDVSRIPDHIKLLYSVAPRPYISGTFADVLRLQTPLHYMPTIEQSEGLSFEERLKLGFQQAMSEGLDYFFGISLVLVNVGEKLRDSSGGLNIRPFLKSPRALLRLARGKVRSRLARRALLPKDIWTLRGIIGSGVDSWIYKDKIKELWGRHPLDLYSCTEGGVIATQTWDYDGMTFFPNLNFLEFIPEDEQLKWQMDSSYKPKTLLLNEVEAGEKYEIVITNFHGGAMTRYRIGDMVKITALRNEKLGIKIPQMAFERRVDDFINFYVVALTEKSIWQALESTGVPYVDWIAYKDAENLTLNIGLELKDGYPADTEAIASLIYKKVLNPDNNISAAPSEQNDLTDMADFKIKVDLLPKGTFAGYIARKQAEGADLAHLKPPHVNPSEKVLSILTAETEETIIVTKAGARTSRKSSAEKAKIS
ncbi:MAG: hypothetical protein A2Z29_08115 [Chloroflexi bacterium RBG_16_56_11]|nr:MAG: hypothetical protein A2Z29_08115 [Chloroflexi bacterium RBG_16_56_11]